MLAVFNHGKIIKRITQQTYKTRTNCIFDESPGEKRISSTWCEGWGKRNLRVNWPYLRTLANCCQTDSSTWRESARLMLNTLDVRAWKWLQYLKVFQQVTWKKLLKFWRKLRDGSSSKWHWCMPSGWQTRMCQCKIFKERLSTGS